MNNIISNQLKKIIISVMLLLVITAALFVLTSCKNDGSKVLNKGSGTETTSATETTNQDAKQIIEVIAKSGGYSPRKIEAKAGVPTTLVMKSEGAYGCERAFNIPDLGISKILPENGITEFDLGTQAKGTKLIGVCGMGMYYFQITFN
jgi:uncharacterized protein